MGSLRCVERCWPITKQVPRSETSDMAANAQRNAGGGRGSVVSRESLLQYLLVQYKVGYSNTKPLVLLLKVL